MKIRVLLLFICCVFAFSQPSTVSVTPSSGAGLTQSFSLNATSSNGFQWMGMVIGPGTFNNACNVLYGWDSIYLRSDDDNSYAGIGSPGSAGIIQNSQCSINLATSSAVPSGNQLTVNLAITFNSGLAGPQIIMTAATDNS
jgi:hypothetical protein